MKTVDLKLIDDTLPSAVEITFIPDEYSITCLLKYDEKPNESKLSDCIAAQFDIPKVRPVVDFGYTSIQFDSQLRLVSLDVFTNFERWAAATIKPVSVVAGGIFLDESFDSNGHCASGDDAYKEIYDQGQSCFALVWQDATRWIQLADKLMVGLVSKGKSAKSCEFQLAELRIFGIRHGTSSKHYAVD